MDKRINFINRIRIEMLKLMIFYVNILLLAKGPETLTFDFYRFLIIYLGQVVLKSK